MRGRVRICEYPGCPNVVRTGHPYPLDTHYCADHAHLEPVEPTDSEEAS